MQKTVSHEVTKSDVESWSNGDIVTINADTGLGKSYFIMNKLYNHCKDKGLKILILTSRNACRDQFEMDVEGKEDTITIMTYQKIEYHLMHNSVESLELESYDYINCDEHHYFLSDSDFSYNTDKSLEKILSLDSSIRIFMSATGEMVNNLIQNYYKQNIISYEVKRDKSNLSRVEFYYNGQEAVKDYFKYAIKSPHKSIFFLGSLKLALELYKQDPINILFVCSERADEKYTRHMDIDSRDKMLRDEKFSEKILITTTTLDIGVNIKDDKVKDVVTFLYDTDSVIQCMGRKRFTSPNDKFNLYVSLRNNQQLGGDYSKIARQIKNAKDHTLKDIDSLITNNAREDRYDELMYVDKENDVVELKVFKIKLIRYMLKKAEIYNILQLKGGHLKYMSDKLELERFGVPYTVYETKEDRDERVNNNKFLSDLVGVKLFNNSEKRKQIVDIFHTNNKYGKKLKSVDAINSNLKESNYKYTIIKDKDNQCNIDNEINPNFRKVYWMVEETLD